MDDSLNNQTVVLPKHVINIVWQYAPENQPHLIEQKKHLQMLNSSGLIIMRDREGILAGEPIEFVHHIEHADLVIPLISSHLFNAPDNCGIDMPYVVARYQAGELYILSLYISSCDYYGAFISQLPIITAKGKAITHWHGNERQAAYTYAAEEIRKIVEILLTLKWKVTAEGFYVQNYYDFALKACENTLQFYEKNPSFHSHIADTSLLQRFQDALVSCYILQTKVFLSSNQFETALAACSKGMQIQPYNPFLNFNKGYIFYCLNKFEEAIEALNISIGQFKEARKKDTTGILYKRDLHGAYVELGKACEALARQERQKWLQRRDEANKMARKLEFEGKQKHQFKKRHQ